jgi:hypothetical protein
MKKLKDMTEPELAQLMTLCGNMILESADALGVEKPMFVVLLFNDPATAQYVANCQRADVILALREAAERLERHEDKQLRVPFIAPAAP